MLSLHACLPCFWRWDIRRDDPERQRLFPPPDTVLTPPRRHPSLPSFGDRPLDPSAAASAPFSPTGIDSAISKQSDGTARGRGRGSPGLSQVSRERIGSISRAYQGRMLPLAHRSHPTTPSASYFFPHGDASVPPPSGLHHPGSGVNTQHFHRQIRPTRSVPITPLPADIEVTDTPNTPNRPAAPNLGRSASEPRSLMQLGITEIFAPHQLVPGVNSSQQVARGGRGRPRSATVLERLSPIHTRTTSEDIQSWSRATHAGGLHNSGGTVQVVMSPGNDTTSGRTGDTHSLHPDDLTGRGRSPGPSCFLVRSTSDGVMSNSSGRDLSDIDVTELVEEEAEGHGGHEGAGRVVRLDLGLRELGHGSSRSRGRSRPGRGRRVTTG